MTLETIIEEKSANKMRRIVANTFASVSFSLVVGGSNDYYVGNLHGTDWIKSRAFNITVSALGGDLYDRYKEKLDGLFNVTEESSKMKQLTVGGGAYISFWIPLYATALKIIGVENEQIKHACLTGAMIFPWLSAPYNWYLGYVHRKFGVTPKVEA